MKIKENAHIIMIYGALFAGLVSCAPQVEQKAIASSISSEKMSKSRVSSVEHQIHVGINQVRVNKGKKPLIRHRGLDKLALNHARYMAHRAGGFNLVGKNISHYGAEGRLMIAKRRYSMRGLSENVTYQRGDIAGMGSRMVKSWVASPDHNYQINSGWTHTGIATVVDSQGRAFGVQLFALKDASKAIRTFHESGF